MKVLPNTDFADALAADDHWADACCLIAGNRIVHAMNFFSWSICASLSRCQQTQHPVDRGDALAHEVRIDRARRLDGEAAVDAKAQFIRLDLVGPSECRGRANSG